MPELTATNVGLAYGYIDGENGWGSGMNTNLIILDSLIQGSVQSRVLTAPPAVPLQGQMWIVPAGATGAWAGHTNQLAIWKSFGSTGWIFRTPSDGWRFFTLGEQIFLRYNGTTWIAESAGVPGSGLFGYNTVALMNADTTRAVGSTGAVFNDPDITNNFPRVAFLWNGSAWIKGYDNLAAIISSLATITLDVARTVAGVSGLYAALAAPWPLAWLDTSSYVVAYPTALTSPSTRFTAVPSAAGLTITGLPGMPGIQPIGIKLPYDLLPGDSIYVKAKYLTGTVSGNSGVMIGTDPVTTGPFSAGARWLNRRSTILQPTLDNGATGDGARTVLPGFSAPAFINGTEIGFLIDAQSDRSLSVKIFQDNLQVSGDVTVAPATQNGALIIGMMIVANSTATISMVTRKASSGPTLYVHSGAAVSGNGTFGSPLKSLNDINGAIVAQGLIGQPVTVELLTDNIYGYHDFKQSISPRWTVNGLPGGNTTLNGFNFGEVPVWNVAAGTSNKVFTTPLKHGLDLNSHPNQVFIYGLGWNPRPWYSFPNTCLKTMVTTNAGVDMVGEVSGACSSVAGVLYVRLPDGMPSFDPSTYPQGGFSIVVARMATILSVTGAPEVNLNNITLRWSAGALMSGGAGFGTFNNFVMEWSGYNNPNLQVENGQYIIDGGYSKYSDGDGIGRTPRIDKPFQAGSILTTVLRNFEISHTGSQAGASGGDGISDHVLDIVFDASNRANRLYMTNVYIHDCWKCGYVGSDDYLKANGIRIVRCGTEQFAVLAVNTANAAGRTQRAIVSDFHFDPEGYGTTGARTVYTDGMALCELNLSNGYIGLPAAGGRELEALAVPLTISGVPQVRDISNNVIRYANVKTAREPGLVVKNGDGIATGTLTFSANPANGDTVTIGAVVYTFNTTLGGANSIKIGGSSTVTRNNLIGAITADPLLIATGYGTGTVVHPTVTALPIANNAISVRALVPGTGGNAIVTTEVSTALSFGAGTLTGGVAASGTFQRLSAYELV